MPPRKKPQNGTGDSADVLIVPPGESPVPIPQGDSEPIRVGELVTEPESPQEPEVTEFSDEERETFASLLTVGYRIEEFSVMGHLVKMVTPNVDDELMIAQFTKEFRETEGYVRAYQIAAVACSIREIDGVPVYANNLMAKPDLQEGFNTRLEKVRAMYPLVVSLLYKNIVEMEQKYVEMARKLGKL